LNCASQDPAYSRLKRHLIASTGLAFEANQGKNLAEAVGQRLSTLGLRGCSAYARLLADPAVGEAEMDALLEQLAIGETSFFRDPEQFAAIRDIILPEILERKQFPGQLRIWSAGCATGAEPYSLAILLMDEMPGQLAGWQVHIDATDLNGSYLTRAAEGKFRPWALRSISDRVKRECFSKQGLELTIHPRYKEWISFHRMNLAGSEFSTVFAAGAFDLILCRNVMIYFRPETTRRLIGQLHKSLGNEGWLVVGASENNVENYTDFRNVPAAGATLYQKMAASPEQKEVAPEPPPLRPVAAPAPVQSLPTDIGAPYQLAGLRQLADCGDWHGAAEYGQTLLTRDRLNPAIPFYLALIFENLGMQVEAERSWRQAI